MLDYLKEIRLLISIHAPRTGSDLRLARALDTTVISIHAPRTGSDWIASFLKTLPKNFNPRSPHGERHGVSDKQVAYATISIHAPRTGSDERANDLDYIVEVFQSTLPARGATRHV